MRLKLALCLFAALTPLAAAETRWWESASAIVRVTLKPGRSYAHLSLEPARLSAQLDRIKQAGFDVVEIFATPHGGWSYGGLDAIDRYRIDPEVGTMDDFRRLVRTAHDKRLKIIGFDNLGYSSVEAPHFLKACDDVREGRDTAEAHWFLWADRADAPPPATGDSFYLVRPVKPGYDALKNEVWVYSERAKKYYWSKWGGVDSKKNRVRLPQYNWAAPEFQREAEKVVRFWMDTGLDGMIIDAVNWYVGYTWQMGRQRLTGPIASYGAKFSQPEGAGGFHEDPVAWITEGGWNCVQDYGLGIWWEKDNNVLRDAIVKGDPRPVETALRDYHDRVVAAGGVLYFEPPKLDDPAQKRLSAAALAGFGDLMYFGWRGEVENFDEETAWILKTKAAHPALYQLGSRRKLPVRADDKHYAFLRTAPDGSERMLVVLNFQPEPQTVEVDLSGLAASALTDVKTGELRDAKQWLDVPLPAFGYRFFRVSPASR
ncbi:MAG: alpha-amylase family glycosyl hydrolase [Acidobacteriota bacterium]